MFWIHTILSSYVEYDYLWVKKRSTQKFAPGLFFGAFHSTKCHVYKFVVFFRCSFGYKFIAAVMKYPQIRILCHCQSITFVSHELAFRNKGVNEKRCLKKYFEEVAIRAVKWYYAFIVREQGTRKWRTGTWPFGDYRIYRELARLSLILCLTELLKSSAC